MSVAMGTPAMLTGPTIIQRYKQRCGNNHSTQRADDRQRGFSNVGQLTVRDFVLDLHPYQEEENGHQRVVDPTVDGKLDAGEC
jgi:hypothetical protein